MRILAAIVAAVLCASPLFAATEKRLDEAKPIVVRAERTVTIDVKDAEVAVILKDMQKQCGIRNLMIDPNVKGKGTFYFREVPCRQAWDVVLRSMGLDSVTYTNSIATVSTRRR